MASISFCAPLRPDGVLCVKFICHRINEHGNGRAELFDQLLRSSQALFHRFVLLDAKSRAQGPLVATLMQLVWQFKIVRIFEDILSVCLFNIYVDKMSFAFKILLHLIHFFNCKTERRSRQRARKNYYGPVMFILAFDLWCYWLRTVWVLMMPSKIAKWFVDRSK